MVESEPAGEEAGTPAPEATAPAAKQHSRVLVNVLGLTLALLGGFFGIIGAMVQELGSALPILGPIFVAPLVEETLKPAGIYLLLIAWPWALRSRLHTAILTAISGACFGYIESWVYVNLYAPGAGSDFALFRYTVTPAMHVIASFTAGLGLDRGIIDWANGRGRFPRRTRNLFLLAMLIHGVYNTVAVVLSLTGVLDFDN